MAVSKKAGTATVLPKLRPQDITAVPCCPVVASEFALLLSSSVVWVVTACSSGRGKSVCTGTEEGPLMEAVPSNAVKSTILEHLVFVR
jgi:hypothetical protein